MSDHLLSEVAAEQARVHLEAMQANGWPKHAAVPAVRDHVLTTVGRAVEAEIGGDDG